MFFPKLQAGQRATYRKTNIRPKFGFANANANATSVARNLFVLRPSTLGSKL